VVWKLINKLEISLANVGSDTQNIIHQIHLLSQSCKDIDEEYQVGFTAMIQLLDNSQKFQ
jgi:hypothetical protein